MSRSRRRPNLGRCICGRRLVRFRGQRYRGKFVAACPILDYPHEHNERRERFRREREHPHTAE